MLILECSMEYGSRNIPLKVFLSFKKKTKRINKMQVSESNSIQDTWMF